MKQIIKKFHNKIDIYETLEVKILNLKSEINTRCVFNTQKKQFYQQEIKFKEYLSIVKVCVFTGLMFFEL